MGLRRARKRGLYALRSRHTREPASKRRIGITSIRRRARTLPLPWGTIFAGLGSSAELVPAPFRSEFHFSSGSLGGGDPWRLVCAAHHFHCACDYSDGVHCVDEDSLYNTDAPDEEWEEGCGLLELCYCE